jgi:hypothetical protein
MAENANSTTAPETATAQPFNITIGRRALFAGALAAPLIAAAPLASAAGPEHLHRAVKKCIALQAEMDEGDFTDEEWQEAADREWDVLREVLKLPATPEHAAIRADAIAMAYDGNGDLIGDPAYLGQVAILQLVRSFTGAI